MGWPPCTFSVCQLDDSCQDSCQFEAANGWCKLLLADRLKRCHVNVSPTDVSPNVCSWTLRPLYDTFLGPYVPRGIHPSGWNVPWMSGLFEKCSLTDGSRLRLSEAKNRLNVPENHPVRTTTFTWISIIWGLTQPIPFETYTVKKVSGFPVPSRPGRVW
jgi:hypothetical protein